MKPLSPKLIFLFSSRSLSTTPALPISRFSTYSSSPPSFPARRHEEESRGVRVSVWWDFENCQLPAGANVFKVGQSIAAAVRANGIKGPVQITAFGDMLQLSRSSQEALSATGINLTHIPHGSFFPPSISSIRRRLPIVGLVSQSLFILSLFNFFAFVSFPSNFCGLFVLPDERNRKSKNIWLLPKYFWNYRKKN